MLPRIFYFWLFIFSMAGVTVLGQEPGNVKILLPIVADTPFNGAYGSRWSTRISLVNTADRDVVISGFMLDNCQVGCGPFRPTPPDITFTPQLFPFSFEVEGYFFFSTDADEPFVNVQVHVQDLSRQAQTWGTEIPTVPERQAFTGLLDLVGAPIGPEFRSRLRIYDFDPARNKQARISYAIYAVRDDLPYPWEAAGSATPPVTTDELLTTGELSFRYATLGYSAGRPGFVYLDLDGIPQLAAHKRVRVRLTSVTSGLRYWAFISTTNNETQHVTTITPR